ncbi:pilus assembly protein PilP [Pseudoteredinibacter isoporae]|uniref:pilus assembly protein PilP n=1 Tax=Pseudoteredinibacter isoporae TaxID=570281 RepID=UPI003103D1D0
MMRYIVLVTAFFVMGGCSFEEQHQDLRDYIEETKRRPRGRIEPLPEFRPYKAFSYAAIKLRSPFEPLKEEQKQEFVGQSVGVEPDLNREKEYLEGFSLIELEMVGTIEKDGVLWGLVSDGQGGVHRVSTGNYVGKNHGRVINTSHGQLDIVEIIPDNLGGWVERPRVLKLEEE